jgi:hypothetical protein
MTAPAAPPGARRAAGRGRRAAAAARRHRRPRARAWALLLPKRRSSHQQTSSSSLLGPDAHADRADRHSQRSALPCCPLLCEKAAFGQIAPAAVDVEVTKDDE